MKFLLQKMGILWREFIPLSISDVTMAIGDPMVNATMAQLPKLQTNLSALGVIKALVVFFESPIIMVLHASNRLSIQQDARHALKQFVILASILLTSCLLILSIPTVFFSFTNLIGLTGEVSTHAHKIFLCLLLWPGSIAIRRYYQGILIIHKQLKTIAKAGILRMTVLAIALSVGYSFHVKSPYLAGGSMMLGILAETLAVFWAARRFVRSSTDTKVTTQEDQCHPKTVKEIWKFYWPLANSMVVVWSARALIVVCLAHAVDSALALAVWPATWALVVLFANSTRMIQQVIIRNKDTFHPGEFILFAFSVGLTLTSLLLGLGASSAGRHILTYFVGDDPELLNGVRTVLCICACIPILVAIQNVLQGFLMCLGNTKAINRSTLYGVFMLLACTSLGVSQNFLGAQVAAYAMVLSLVCENFLLMRQIPWKLYIQQYSQHQKIQEGL